jgi:DeoR family transcriptional regulator, suf operon transcriptional repressor
MLGRLGHTQRQLLKLLLENKNGLTIEDMVKSLDITRTAVYQHVNSLERGGYIEKHALTKTAGRPGQIYVLSDQGNHLFPKQYAWFSELLLSNMKERLGSEGLEEHLRRLGENLADAMRQRLHAATAEDQIAEVAALMQELGYEASLSFQTAEKLPNITACNCVYHNLASKHREVCALDLALLSALTGRKVEHLECMVRGGQVCRFRLSVQKLDSSQTSDYVKLPENPRSNRR